MDGERERCRVQFRNQIYVTRLPCYLHPTRIEKYFERIGKIKVNKKGEKMVKLFFRDREKRTNFEGRCTVTYEDAANAQRAVELLNGVDYKNTGSKIKVIISFGYCDEAKRQRMNKYKAGDWLCKLCTEKNLMSINFEWQKSCFNCNRKRVECKNNRSNFSEVIVNDDENDDKNSIITKTEYVEHDARSDGDDTKTLLNVKPSRTEPKPASLPDVPQHRAAGVKDPCQEQDRAEEEESGQQAKSVAGAGGVNAEDGSAKELSIETLERELEDVLLNTCINHSRSKSMFLMLVSSLVFKRTTTSKFM